MVIQITSVEGEIFLQFENFRTRYSFQVVKYAIDLNILHFKTTDIMASYKNASCRVILMINPKVDH
jgi:hypothetical protein